MPVARPASTPFADDVYARLGPVARQDEDLGWPLLRYVIGVSQMWTRVESIFRALSGKPAASQLLDIDRAPDVILPWLGQFVGVRATAGASPDAQREQIRTHGGFRRGRVDALVAAVQATLTGTKTVRVTERYGGDAYAIAVVTNPSETPDPVATAAAAQGAKAAGLILTYTTSNLPFIDQGTRTIDASTGNIDTATLADIT